MIETLALENCAGLLAQLERPAILLLDDDSSIRLWNRGAEILYGWSAEEVLGRPLSWLTADGADELALVRAELAAVRMTGSGKRSERRRRADRSRVAVAVRKLAEPNGSIWEISEEETLAPAPSEYARLEELLGADLLVFDDCGSLKERSTSRHRPPLSSRDLERAQALAFRALRLGAACEEAGDATDPWLRAVPMNHDGVTSALVLARPALGSTDNRTADLQRLTHLCRGLFEAQETERRRLARELHDDLGQSLTGLLYALEMETVPREQLRGEASALLAKVRRLSQGLRPGILDDLGLAAGLQSLAADHGRRSGLEIQVEVESGGARWPADLETALFRIAQEAMTNTARHASAKTIAIEVEEQDGELRMTIEDDGKGFDSSEASERSTGVASMRERALLLGGRFDLQSAPGRGTRIAVWLPLLGEAAE